MKLSPFFHKLTHWEYWPSYMFYIPILPYYLLKAIQAKTFTFVLVTNPAIKFSGMGTESKYAVMQLMPKELQTKTIVIQPKDPFISILKKLKEAAITFPLIAKPDIGFRGLLVAKITSEEALKKYLQNKDIAILLQEFLDYKHECGIFYSRIPDEDKGKITSITLKEFLTITGNGKDTLATLIKNHQRAYLYYDLFEKIQGEKMQIIPKKKQEIKLTAVGNHSKGTQFINGNHLISPQLEATFDKVMHQIDGWYYGRFDIKYNDFKDLEQGMNFKILELNGLLAEPTHIYDAKHKGASYFTAVKTILNHWKIINNIALKNRNLFKTRPPSFTSYKKEFIFLYKYINQLKKYV